MIETTTVRPLIVDQPDPTIFRPREESPTQAIEELWAESDRINQQIMEHPLSSLQAAYARAMLWIWEGK